METDKITIPEDILRVSGELSREDLLGFISKTNKLLEGMKPGDRHLVKNVTLPKTRELFIEVVKWYMRLHQETFQEGLSFADGYGELRKYDLTWGKKPPLRCAVSPPKGGENPPALNLKSAS